MSTSATCSAGPCGGGRRASSPAPTAWSGSGPGCATPRPLAVGVGWMAAWTDLRPASSAGTCRQSGRGCSAAWPAWLRSASGPRRQCQSRRPGRARPLGWLRPLAALGLASSSSRLARRRARQLAGHLSQRGEPAAQPAARWRRRRLHRRATAAATNVPWRQSTTRLGQLHDPGESDMPPARRGANAVGFASPGQLAEHRAPAAHRPTLGARLAFADGSDSSTPTPARDANRPGQHADCRRTSRRVGQPTQPSRGATRRASRVQAREARAASSSLTALRQRSPSGSTRRARRQHAHQRPRIRQVSPTGR